MDADHRFLSHVAEVKFTTGAAKQYPVDAGANGALDELRRRHVVSYCTALDVVDRLSAQGLVYVADDDGDGVVSVGEQDQIVRAALSAADAEIDLALAPHVVIPVTTSNEWLTHRAVDLAAERLAGRKGQTIPPSLAEAARRTRQWLAEVRAGTLRVPGLAYAAEGSTDSVRAAGRPRLVNPKPPHDPRENACRTQS